jgi:hypothetical protein
MTVSTQTAKSQYTGNGVTVAFTGSFPVLAATHVTVIVTTSGVDSTKILNTDYTISGVGGSTFTVTFGTAPANGTRVTIARSVPLTQELDLIANAALPSDQLEESYDKATMIDQQINERVDRALRQPITDSAAIGDIPALASRTGKFLRFNASTGDPEAVGVADLGAVEFATAAEVTAGTEDDKIVSPKELTEWAAASATFDSAADQILFQDASDSKIKRGLLGLAGGAETITAGENLADRDIIYQDYDNERGGGAGRWYKVDTDATAPVCFSRRIGIAIEAITSGNTGLAQVRAGRVSGFTGLTAGGAVWASTTAGATTQTVPAVPTSGTQNATIVVGVAASTTEIDFEPPVDITIVARNSALTTGSTIVVNHPTDAGAKERVPRAYLAAVASAQTVVAGATGTAIGNMANGGGLAAAFDGNTSQNAAASASITTGDRTTGYVGKDWGSGNTKVISGIVATGASDQGFNQTGTATVTITLYGSTDNFSGSNVSLGSGTVTNGAGASLSKLSGFTTTTGYRYHRIGITDAGASATDNKNCAELVFYEDVTLYEEPVDVASERISSAATDRVTCRFTDASAANGNTNTTFWNRTGATRDLIVEVSL